MAVQINFEEAHTEIWIDELNPALLAGFGFYLSQKYPYDIKPKSVHYSLINGLSKIACESTVRSIYNSKLIDDMLEKYINLKS